jgi:hypothetical protein
MMYDMDAVRAGSLWHRPSDPHGRVYLLTNAGGGVWLLTSLHSSGNSWSGAVEIGHKGSMTIVGWNSVRKDEDFEYLGTMADINVQDLQALTWEDECKDLMWRNQKVSAIQVMRKATGRGLKDAKEYVEKHFPMSRDDGTFKSPF